MATRPASMPLHIMVGSGLPLPDPHVEHGPRAGRAGEHGVDGDDADPQVGAGQRRPGVEAEPAEAEDEGAE